MGAVLASPAPGERRRTTSKAGGWVDHRISGAFEPVSSRHQDWNRHLRQQGSSDAAEDDLGPPRMAVGADDDQIHAAVYGAGENDFADRRSIGCRSFDVDVHAVAGEVERDVGARLLAVLVGS